MRVSRRRVLQAAALGALPGTLRAAPAADVAIHDTRFGTAPVARRTIDLAHERLSLWREVRTGLDAACTVSGLTGWSDYAMIAHALERQGFRRTGEVRTGRGWHWTMTRRS